MPRMNKGRLALALALSVAPIALMPSSPASAQMAVVDVRAIAQMAQQLARQTQMLQQQIQQYQNMIVNTAGLPGQQWGQTMQAIRGVQSAIGQMRSLSFQSNNIEQQLRQKYSGYGSYNSSGMTSAGMSAKYRQWSEDANDTLEGTLKALNLQNSQLDDEDAVMRQIEAMGNTAEGRMQAAQVGNQLAAQAVRQTQKLRQLQMAQINLQAGFYAQQQDRQAAQAAAAQRAFTHTAQPTSGGQGFTYSRN